MPRFAIPYQASIGWSTLVLASLLGLWSGWTMATRGHGTPFPLDTARELVMQGPRRAWPSELRTSRSVQQYRGTSAFCRRNRPNGHLTAQVFPEHVEELER